MPQTSKPRDWYRVTALHQGGAELFIYGNIGDAWWEEESVTAKALIDDLAAYKGQPLDVRINSYGGLVSDGVAIYNALRRHGAPVTVHIDAVAYSIASLIAMAGDTINMAENAMLMLHAPHGAYAGNAQTLRRRAEVLDKYADAMVSAYLRDGGPEADQIEAWLKDGEDHYFTAAEARGLGLVDETTESVDIAACVRDFDLGAYRNPVSTPAAMAAAITSTQENRAMPEKQKPAATQEPAATASQSPVNVVEIEQAAEKRALARLRERNEELAPAFDLHMSKPGVSALHAKVMADPEMTADQARMALLEHLGKDVEPVNQLGPQITTGTDERDKRRSGMEQAILARIGAAEHDRANPYRGMRLADVAKACLETAGVNVRGMTPEELAPIALSHVRAAQTTSDFPVILENVLHKLVLTGFQAQTSTWERFCKTGDVTDFREWNRIVPGLLGDLDPVNEAGEYRDKPLPDGEGNGVSVKRRGNIINITPEVLVNDDLGLIQSMAMGLGGVGNRAIERAVYQLLSTNPVLKDGVALFHASHNNLAGTGAAPSITTLDEAAVAMSMQKAPGDDQEYLDIQPTVGLVHRSGYGNFVEVIKAEFNDESGKNQRKPNRVRGIVDDVVASPRLGTTAEWYLFADPMIAPVIEVVFLNGQRAPRLTQEESFRTGGLSWRVEMPFGVGAIDYRGAFKNAGV